MGEVAIAPASSGDVRAIQHRRHVDAAGVALSLGMAEQHAVWVARDEGTVVGIVAVHRSGEEWYAGDLFVEPSFRGQGIGGRLLDAAFEGSNDAARAMLVDERDAAAVALALRRRLAPCGSLLRFAGAIPREDELAAMAAGDYRFDVAAIDPAAHAFGLDALDREVRGTARLEDHEAFAIGATGHAFFLNGEFVAYAYVWPDGRIGPIASASAAYLVQIFAFALVTLQRRHGASWCSALVPGTNLRVARTALRAGLRIEGSSALAADAPLELSRYVGLHALLL